MSLILFLVPWIYEPEAMNESVIKSEMIDEDTMDSEPSMPEIPDNAEILDDNPNMLVNNTIICY